jgi:hypothetical protein
VNLVRVWGKIRSDDIIEHEIASAAIYNGIDLSNIYINIPNPLIQTDDGFNRKNYKKWIAFMLGKSPSCYNDNDTCNEVILQKNGDYLISLFCILKVITKKVDSRFSQMSIEKYKYFVIIILCSFINMIPFFTCFNKSFSSMDLNFYVFWTSTCIITSYFLSVILYFAQLSLNDILRQKESLVLYVELCKGVLCKEHKKPLLFNENKIQGFKNYKSENVGLKKFDYETVPFKHNNCSSSFKVLYETDQHIGLDQDLFEMPVINFEDESNIIAWSFGRVVLIRFGARFRARIESFVGKI